MGLAEACTNMVHICICVCFAHTFVDPDKASALTLFWINKFNFQLATNHFLAIIQLDK